MITGQRAFSSAGSVTTANSRSKANTPTETKIATDASCSGRDPTLFASASACLSISANLLDVFWCDHRLAVFYRSD